MSLASRPFVHFLRRSPMAGAGVQNAILVARHRCLSSASSSSRDNSGPTATNVAAAAPAVVVTDTKAGGGTPEQQGLVKLDACGEIEGAVLRDEVGS